MNTEAFPMKDFFRIILVSVAVASTGPAVAQAGVSSAMDEAALSSWEHMVSLEPCMNGDVSASGLYPSQIAEDKSFATLGRLAVLSRE